MDKEALFRRIENMIASSTKEPKYMALSTVKLADLFGVMPSDIEEALKEFEHEGRLVKDKLEEPPHSAIYYLPQ